MLLVHNIAVVLHVLTAAAFFGLGLPLARTARSFADSRAAVLGEQGARSVRLMTMFAVLTVLFAVTAFVTGGIAAGTNPFAYYGPQFHTSVLLILVLAGVQLGLVQAGWKKLQEEVAAGGTISATKRVAMGVGIAHLIWVVILVLMFWSDLAAGFGAV